MSVAETQGEKGDSNPKIALLNALRESISDTDRKKGKRGQESVTKCSCWSPALIHIKLLSSAKNDTVLCFYVKL